ncbi:MAG: class I adenylate-forming enzyme family protein [Gammaproteobacteria bacterium]
MHLRLTQALRRARQIRGDDTAVIDADLRLTWNALADRIARFAGFMVALGVQPGDRVAMLAMNGHRYLEFYLGTLWAGGVILPLNHRLSAAELAETIADAAPAVLIAAPEFHEVAQSIAGATTPRPRLVSAADGASAPGFLDYEAGLAGATPAAECARGPDDLACLFYTGGTTGRPKGVMLSHGNQFLNALNLLPAIELDETGVHLHAGPLFHVAAGARLFSATIAAATHVFAPRFAVPQVLDLIEAHGITVASFVPTMMRSVLDYPGLDRYRLPSLRYITYGAAPTPIPLLRAAMERFPHVGFVQFFGQTECSPIATVLRARDHADPALHGSAGRPAPSAELRIVAADGGEAPAGTVGEITVRGPMVMLGYWRNPEATAAALRDGWLHTGDIGYFDARGYLFVVDRIKDMIITGGENVYSTEVEQVLAAHPAVAECAVFGVPDPHWGERVHAVVVPRAGREIDTADLDRHCRAAIAAYKCPRSWELRTTPLPLSNVNKVLKTRLRAETLARPT